MAGIMQYSVKIGRLVNASPEAVWEIITDTEQWPEWGPSVREVWCSDRFIREGSKGRVRTAVGLWVPFVITHFEYGRHWSWKVFGVPATGHRIEDLRKTRCRLIFEVPVLAAPYAVVCRTALNRIARIVE